jgi:C4-type Zn-finger protein
MDFKRRMEKLLNDIRMLMSGNVPFTLIIKDPVDNSFL